MTIKNCPCCDSACELSELRYVNSDDVYAYQIVCPKCNLQMRRDLVCWTVKFGMTSEECRLDRLTALRDDCLASWNRRV